jgi:hypothetical protein
MADPSLKATAAAALHGWLAQLPPDQIGPEFSIHFIAWYALLGAVDEAYAFANRMLDYAVPVGALGVFPNFLWLPELVPFRRDPRFQALVSRLRLFDYWKVHGPPDGCELKEGRLIVL